MVRRIPTARYMVLVRYYAPSGRNRGLLTRHSPSSMVTVKNLLYREDGIVSFERMLVHDLSPRDAHVDSGCGRDISFGHWNVVKSAIPIYFHFRCAVHKEASFLLGNNIRPGDHTKFKSWIQLALYKYKLPYPGNHFDFSVQIHREKENQFALYKTGDIGENAERNQVIKKSIEAHEKLESYLKKGRL